MNSKNLKVRTTTVDRLEMILEGKDASDWIYRGEGVVNLVLAYAGSSPAFAGKVIRIRKARENDKTDKSTTGTAVLTSYDQLLWRDNEELISHPSKEVLEQRFVKHVMSPLLGPKHVDAGMHISVSTEFLVCVGKKVMKQRSSCCVNAANVDTLRDSVVLTNDHTVFSPGISTGSDCLSVEIKPKCGFLPTSKFISDGNMLKRSVSRFKMNQILKLQYNKIVELSEYDPIDLFSGSKERICKAIKALYSTPQNYFRVFLNGSLIFGGFDGTTSRTSLEIGEAFEDALKGFIHAGDGLRAKSFIELVSEAVYSSRVLDRLLEVQKLDNLDIDGAIHSYYDIISQPCPICKEFEEDGVPLQYTSLHSLPLDESLKIVRDYLIAATAKDCNMMISFRPGEAGDSAGSCINLYLQSTNQVFDYKVHFIDLDLRLLKTVESNYKSDKKIVSFYNEKLKVENGENKAVCTKTFESER